METPDTREILRKFHTFAVVGLSPKPHRDSHKVARFLQEHGYRIIPVRPGADSILGERCYATLGEIPQKVDVVNLFRRSEAVAPFVDQAIAIQAKVVWMQLGVIHEEAAERARRAGLLVVMDHCPLIEYRKHFGSSPRPV
ncbi:MAG: CoA-binding protein [Acidobacteria bacterium]|nr:CoA-binding protein [Acidobacteriota bacterium]MCI0567007.1 CoA-binding protein [Acidobacteriota bacterium]